MSIFDDIKILQIYRKKGYEEGVIEGFENGFKEGFEKGKIISNLKNAIAMFDMNYSISDVIKITKIPEENAKYISSLCNNGHTDKEIQKLSLYKYYSFMNN